MDVQQAYDEKGQPRKDVIAVTNGCWDRILGDLDACYQRK